MKSKGQSLIEVLVALGVVSLLLVSLLTIVSTSIKNSRIAKDRTLAVELAQEGMELMRAYRDFSWSEFSDKASGTNWLLVDDWTVEVGLDVICPSTVADYFKRCVELSSGDGVVDVQMIVSWFEGDQEMQTVQTTKLSRWER